MPSNSTPYVLFRDDPAGQVRRFAAPLGIIQASTDAEFFPALEKLERARADGHWLVGQFSYEASYLLEPKLRPLLPEGRRVPLLNFGIFEDAQDAPAPPPAAAEPAITGARADWTFRDYEARFRKLHRHLRLGDCYQANLTFPIRARWSGDPETAFEALSARQPVKYGALVRLGETAILSRSPELFFEVDGDGWIEAHPMKGTAPRGKTPAEDERLRNFLQNDEKNQAENRMIVDLLRNDISLISEVGTLEAPELFRIESYPTVHQMVSRVRARLLPDLTVANVFAALFPCGSITGAPKIRAMETLRQLETQPRDAYCGAIGWIAPDGRMRFNVAIRTIALYPDGEAVYNVGGGVVFDSTAESEYRECLLKARFVTGEEPASS